MDTRRGVRALAVACAFLGRGSAMDVAQEKDACGVGFVYQPTKTHVPIALALNALSCLEHRGACGADGESGDGAGILTSIPWKILEANPVRTAVAMVFLPAAHTDACKKVADTILLDFGFTNVRWRKVPVNMDALGILARANCPEILQIILSLPDVVKDEEEIEQLLVQARKKVINDMWAVGHADFYIASMSTKTIVYKGMVKSEALGEFYLDLQDKRFESEWAVYHRRFSTNTMPRWMLAQPFRFLAHNGEINTLLGNRNWMTAREQALEHPSWQTQGQFAKTLNHKGSDSANLDNVMELLVRSDRSPEEALMQLMPEAYKDKGDLPPTVVDFYEYYSALQEPWDGPALIVYSDGKTIGAKLDRNGLRPARYVRLRDGSMYLSSETGVVPFPESEVVEKGRLGPGQMIALDITSGALLSDDGLKLSAAARYPYSQWLNEQRKNLQPQPFLNANRFSGPELLIQELAFGYGKEDIDPVIESMASSGKETVFSMGDDTPLAVLSANARLLTDYFKQRFAQVTNPPIDHLREKIVLSLDTYLGLRTGLFEPQENGARLLKLDSPVINEKQLEQIFDLGQPFSAQTLQVHFDATNENMESAIASICVQAEAAVHDGHSILVLTDRAINAERAAIPMLLAVGAVHHHLIRKGLRLKVSLVAETGQCWSTHQFASLLGYGAQAICPYLAFEIVRHWYQQRQQERIEAEAKGVEATTGAASNAKHISRDLTIEQAQANFRIAVHDGLFKTLAKMGISVLSSYVGAQVFECVGLGPKVIAQCFEGTPSRIGGLELSDIAREALEFHRRGFPFTHKQLPNYGMMTYRAGGEFHGNNPKIVRALHAALGFNQRVVDMEERRKHFAEYSDLILNRPAHALRDLLSFKSDRKPIPLEHVEPAEDIVRRFCTGGMSLGALSKEAHETLAIAMNRLGAKSNSGEGGEDPVRYYPIKNIGPDGTSPDFPGLRGLRPGDKASSAVRQVASARFGVTPEYLVTAEQLEIKIAQGAKPGEGGQLPGHKVSDYIAKLRLAKPGTTLISPPPHHDIYSIEDLAQLIFDLRQVNRQAKISVKLVSSVGIGTVAAGVAKADADIIQISGNDGGTGASALSSIKHAGVPWELGLAETHQTLVANRLRDRVLLRVDGGLKSGWEIVTAAMLGAQEYGFGSIALVSAGCLMARICHTNNCPVGITSQKESLRKRFNGTPDQIVEFFLFVANEVRFTLAELGYRCLEDLIGRTDLLELKQSVTASKARSLDFSYVLARAETDPLSRMHSEPPRKAPKPVFDDRILLDDDVRDAIRNHGILSKCCKTIKNTDRAVGSRIAGVIVKAFGDHGYKGRLTFSFNGSAGQSFGAFIVDNMRLVLMGDANDYVGKGMNGGEIVLRPPTGARYSGSDNVIAGNTCLYGATGGALFCAGRAGERFAVRNSAATAVVEGIGDHGCEYMTGGTVVVLGAVGRNFGAGMTGGHAYVLDEQQDFVERRFCHEDDKIVEQVSDKGERELKKLIEQHLRLTDSARAREILADWARYLPLFKQVLPTALASASTVEHTETVRSA